LAHRLRFPPPPFRRRRRRQKRRRKSFGGRRPLPLAWPPFAAFATQKSLSSRRRAHHHHHHFIKNFVSLSLFFSFVCCCKIEKTEKEISNLKKKILKP
tara:strand:- start:167 stop:460 length:294 start_codon:yes stop_codon:yes gene_type:complete